MAEKIDALLNKQVGFEGIFYIIGLSVLAILAVFLIIFLLRVAFHIERLRKKSAHTIIKSIIIGIVPAIYLIIEGLEVSTTFPFSVAATITAIAILVVAVWNFLSFGLLGAFVLTFAQCVYSALLVLGVLSIVYAIAAILIIGAIFLFSGGSGGGETGSSGVPSHLRDPSTGENFYTTTGANGQPYVRRHGSELPLHMTSYGRWIDSNGNEYVS